MRSCDRPLARRHSRHQRLYGLYWGRHFNFVLSADGQRWPVWNHRPNSEQRIRWMRKHRSAPATDESVRPAAATVYGSGPVLQRGLEYSAAFAATGVHGHCAAGSKRPVAEERRIGVTTVQLRLPTVGCVRDAFVSIQHVVWISGTVCIVDADNLWLAASYRERCVANASLRGHYGHAAVQFWLYGVCSFWWNRGVQRWHMVCFNSVQQPNRHTVHHAGGLHTEQRATLAAAMLGAAADDTERRMGSGATRRGGDSAMQPGLRVERGCITDRVPPRYGKSVRRCTTPGGYVGPVSCVVRASVWAAATAVAAHWAGVLRDPRCSAKRQMDSPGRDYRHATVQPIVHWNLYRPRCQRRVGNEHV